MDNSEDYLFLNRSNWNNRVETHLQSEFYDLENFKSGKNSLNTIELELLGDVTNKTILHLQCHFGQDSLSLARLGAQVTGADISDKAIEAANKLNAELKLNCKFVCCDLYSLPEKLTEKFDIVFTSYGTIGWLPDINRWAGVVSHFLKPGGQFVFAEFHPVVWMFDNNFEKIAYRYFTSEPIVESETHTYADKKKKLELKSVTWNHSISEVLNALLLKGLRLNVFNEYDYSPYNCFQKTVEFESGKFRIAGMNNYLPMVYALKATKQ